MKRFSNAVVIVTGAGRGIGKTIAVEFAKEGAVVIVAGRTLENVQKTAREINAKGGEAISVQVDVSNYDQVNEMMINIIRNYSKIDVLVNNAGIAKMSLFEDITLEQWRNTLSVDLDGVFYCCKSVLPYMKEKRYGKIINISSMAGCRISSSGSVDYTAAKHGVIGFTKHLGFELGRYNINVNAVCPGSTLTPLLKKVRGEEVEKMLLKAMPLGRIIYPEDIAQAVLFLSSEHAKMITGSCIDVDGGQWLGVLTDYISDIKFKENSNDISPNKKYES